MQTYLKTFTDKAEATSRMNEMNVSAILEGRKSVVVVTEGPSQGEWTVMDLDSAIDFELPYFFRR
jgi:hypothetical protein